MAQLSLFEAGQLPPATGLIAAADPGDEVRNLGQALPKSIHLGTSSWSFPGWHGLVYDRPASTRSLARHGLAAYARHPLLRTVGIDRTYYRPATAEELAVDAAAVPETFRFVVKAHDVLTWRRFPDHPRYGELRGQPNRLFLDPAYATDHVIGPWIEGLGAKAGVLVFQLPPQDLGSIPQFVGELRRFMAGLPDLPTFGGGSTKAVYAVEVRNRNALVPAYAEALAEAGVVHCLSRHARMPGVLDQAEATLAVGGPALVARWMLPPGRSYEEAKQAYSPFDRLVDPDFETRRDLAVLARAAVREGHPVYITINNKAEGSAPHSAIELARQIVEADRQRNSDQ